MRPDTSSAVDRLREELVSRREIYAGRLLHVFEDQVRLADGTLAVREVVEHRGAVAIVAVDETRRVVLVRQWRHAVGGALWEIPAGTREIGEDPADTARRELAEETGYVATRWQPLPEVPVSPGYSRELMSFHLATGLCQGPTNLDKDERIDVMLAGPDEIRELIAAGSVDCKTLAGLALVGLLPVVEAVA